MLKFAFETHVHSVIYGWDGWMDGWMGLGIKSELQSSSYFRGIYIDHVYLLILIKNNRKHSFKYFVPNLSFFFQRSPGVLKNHPFF